MSRCACFRPAWSRARACPAPCWAPTATGCWSRAGRARSELANCSCPGASASRRARCWPATPFQSAPSCAHEAGGRARCGPARAGAGGRVSEQAAYATLVLDAELARSELSERDRALATEITYGVLRRRSRLDRAIAAYSQRGLAKLDPRALDAARVGAYQILFLRVPAHAAADDAVGAVKRARGPRLAAFTNAVLRRLAERGEPPLPADPLEGLLTEESCPRWIYAELARLLGPDQAA